MERTISGMMGKGSVNHNIRAFTAKNVDRERSKNNVEFSHADIKQVYHELFDDALQRYNEKQKRKDRQIDNYYEKIRQGKQEKLFYEVIFQIGNKDDMNAKSEEGQLAKQILMDFMEKFQERNPYLHVFSAHLHMDEETPHVHIDFVPFICDSSRGLDTRVSLKGALAAQGFHGGTRGDTEWNQWIESEKQVLAKVMERYNITWLQKGTHNKHLSVLEFEKQERAKEVAELDSRKDQQMEEIFRLDKIQQIQTAETEKLRRDVAAKSIEVEKLGSAVNNMKKELWHLAFEQVSTEEAIGQLKQEGTDIRKENDVLQENNRRLYSETAELTAKIENIQTDTQGVEDRQIRLQNGIYELGQEQRRLQLENQALEQKQEMLQEDNKRLEMVQSSLLSDNKKAQNDFDRIQSEKRRLEQEQSKLKENNQKLADTQDKLRGDIERSLKAEKFIQQNIRKYDEDPEWQLPEPGAFVTAKAYRDKFVSPLVSKLKELVKSLTVHCIRLKDESLRMKEKIKNLTSDINFYKERIQQISRQAEQYRECADDLERVRNYAGDEQIDSIIREARERELMERQRKERSRII